MAELTFDVRELGHIPAAVLVSMAGAIDASTVVNFQSTLENLQLKGVKRFILDMEGIKYVNSTGLGSLVRLADQLESDGGGFALVKIHPKVKVVFDMLGLNAFFKIFPNQDAAEKHFGDMARDEMPAGGAVAPPPPSHVPPPPPPPMQGGGTQMRQAGAMGGGMPPMPQQPGRVQARAINCEGCGVTLRIAQVGTFKCSKCGSVFQVQPNGQVGFTQVNKVGGTQAAPPLQMNLSCREECRKGLVAFVTVIAQHFGFTPDRIQALNACVAEVVQHICMEAYGNNTQSTYSVLIAPRQGEINLKFADHGRPFNLQNPRLFQTTRRYMQGFDLKPHPQGGNILTLKMTAQGF